MSKTEQKPSVGRIVMFVPNEDDQETRHNQAEILPAVVVRTWEDTSYENDEVNLKVLTDGPADTWRTSVPYNSEKKPGTWHWPERV